MVLPYSVMKRPGWQKLWYDYHSGRWVLIKSSGRISVFNNCTGALWRETASVHCAYTGVCGLERMNFEVSRHTAKLHQQYVYQSNLQMFGKWITRVLHAENLCEALFFWLNSQLIDLPD
jgi:hypothetical protein